MASPASRKPVMTLYSGAATVQSHSCRIVLYEKDVECQIHYLENEHHEELAELNPYNETPTLVDRELVLYGPQIINEYLDERLPHPPLMPVDPVNRGRARLMILRILRDWYELIDKAGVDRPTLDARSRQVFRDGLISISPVFNEQPYVMGVEFGLVDCFMAPILWRLPLYGIELPYQARPIADYANRLFERESFMGSLSEAENEIR